MLGKGPRNIIAYNCDWSGGGLICPKNVPQPFLNQHFHCFTITIIISLVFARFYPFCNSLCIYGHANKACYCFTQIVLQFNSHSVPPKTEKSDHQLMAQRIRKKKKVKVDKIFQIFLFRSCYVKIHSFEIVW